MSNTIIKIKDCIFNIGKVVMTKYNNKAYRIDDIMTTMNPLSSFKLCGKSITFVEYYQLVLQYYMIYNNLTSS